ARHRHDRLRCPDGHRRRRRHGAVHPGGQRVRETLPPLSRCAFRPGARSAAGPGREVTAPTIAPVQSAKPAGAPGPVAAGRVARVAVLGASGYSGHEFVRLALAHPGLEIAALVSREYAGRPAGELLPGVDARAMHLPAPVAPDALPGLLAQGAFDTLV